MAAVKFSKQNIQPNPLEVDYWVDIVTNPYGGVIKYHNGYDWVALITPDGGGAAVNLDNYYTKIQVNQMLSNKASVESVENKVDDEEIAEVIKNITFSGESDENVTMTLFKYNNATVAVTLPTASSTTSGIVTASDFKDLVKQYQLQDLYTEMYDTFNEIRTLYQPRLTAGKNITIDRDTNTIHATGELSVDWADIARKPDFKAVATSGDYNDLTNKLKAGTSINIGRDNIISVAFDINTYATKAALNNSITQLTNYIDSTWEWEEK